MSYKVYAGTQTDVGVWDTKACIHDPGAEDNAQLLISPSLTREAGKAGSFEATLPLGNVAHSALQKLKTIVEVEQDDVPLWRGRVMSHDMDFYLRQKLYCEGELAYLNDSSLTPYKYTNLSIKEFLGKALSSHNGQTDRYKRFELGTVTVMAEKVDPFMIVVATGCTVKSEKDDDGSRDYYLVDQDGRRLGYLSGSPSLAVGESQYVNGDWILKIVRTTETPATYDAELKVTFQTSDVNVLRDMTVKVAGTKYICRPGEESEKLYITPFSLPPFGKPSKYYFNYPKAESFSKGYELRDFDVTDNEALNFGDGKNFGTTWNVLQSELTDTYGGYFVVRYSADGKTRYLDYLTDDSITETNSQTVEFGVNMLNLDSYVKAENIVTRVIAVGYQSSGFWIFKSTSTIQEQADDREAQKRYGIITRVIVLDGTSTRQKLYNAAKAELQKNLRYLDGIQVSAIDLKDAGIDTERLGWMKKTRIISQPHGIDTPLLLTKIVEPLDAPDKKKFTFGTSFYSLSDLQALSRQQASTAYSMALSAAGYINANPPKSS